MNWQTNFKYRQLYCAYDQDRQFLGHIGMPDDLPDSIPRSQHFVNLLWKHKPLIVNDCKNDERFKNHPIVCGPPYVTFYGGFPIINEAGYILGTLCVTDTKQDANLSISQIELLTKLTGRLAHQLDIQTQQREFIASKTIDLLNKSIKLTSIQYFKLQFFNCYKWCSS